MPDYVYLLENRLSADQRNALRLVREASREAGIILFLVGDAVRDLTSGHAVRDMEVAVHGNALKLKKNLEKAGAKVWGEDEASRSLYLCFPGTVRLDLVSTHSAEYPRPGKAVLHPASIHEDLRRRDFTVNAMAISLNEGSFGLLMDPLNGAADIEGRILRLVSNYGFLEDPSLLIRATRYRARLGWDLDPRTQTRYENAKNEGVIESLPALARNRELEQIGHEEEGLKVLRALEAEGWMHVLFPAWTSASADEEKLNALHELALELLMQGVHPDMSAAQIRLLTAKLQPKDLAGLKKHMLRPGFVEEWSNLDAIAASFAKTLLAKENLKPSVCFRLFTSYDPEAVLWLGFTSKDAAVRERYNQFLKVWPEARQRIPYSLMQELRITSELPGYSDLVQSIFLELIDGGLSTPEEMRAFLEPHSPPAPPPQVTIKRPRAKRGEARVKEQAFDDEEEESEEGASEDEDLDDMGGDEDEIDLGLDLPKPDLEPDVEPELADDADSDSADEKDDDAEDEPPPVRKDAKAPRASAPAKSAPAPAKTGKLAPVAPVPAHKEAPAAKSAPAKPAHAPVPARTAPAAEHKKPAAAPPAKTAKAVPPAKPAAKPVARPAARPAPKPAAKAVAAKHAHPVPSKSKPAHPAAHNKGKSHPTPKPPAKKPAAKPAKKR